MAAITFNLRIPTARPLTPAEHDENFNNLEDIFTGDVANATMNDAKRMFGLLLKPAAVIFTYTGNVASIPTGYKLCDGSAYTTTLGSGNVPDLRDKFIVGAKQDDSGTAKSNITGALLQTGGSTTHGHGNNFSVNGHTLTEAEMPEHRHDIWTQGVDLGSMNAIEVTGQISNSTTTVKETRDAGGSQPHDHGLSGGVTNGTAIPPFYALAYITYVGV